MADAEDEQEPEAPKGPSIVVVLLLVVGLTVVAGATGGGLGMFLAPTMNAAKEAVKKKEEPDAKAPEYSGGQRLKTLTPIVTNLAKPSHIFIRLESTVIFSKAPETDPSELTAKLTNDFLNFLRTLTIARIEGPSGILHLKTDLNEIARIRSEGLIEEVIISSLVVE